ncbi:MAG TPA: hypothetical protein VKZ18_13935, partial [Polyangia bacterium]|nr:hypothetical protein [Polyangia bacterium]
SDADCYWGDTCGADHHCRITTCGVGMPPCPTDFHCVGVQGLVGHCYANACTTNSDCSRACVNGTCAGAPGQCVYSP